MLVNPINPTTLGAATQAFKVVGETATGFIGALDSLFTSADTEMQRAYAQIRTRMLVALEASDQRQAEMNKEQAKHQSVFVAGARPFALWAVTILYVLALLVNIFSPLLGYTATVDSSDIDMAFNGLMGLGAMRGIDKMRNDWKVNQATPR